MDRFASKVVREDGEQLLFLVTGRQGKAPAWCYAMVPVYRRGAFVQALAQGRIDITRFGRLLLSGAGDAPPEEAQRMMAAYCAVPAS